MSTDEKTKTFDVAVEEPQKKPPYKEGAVWLSESLNLNHLYRVKGHQGLFTPRRTPNKSGMIPMQGFMGTNQLIVKRTELEALGGAVIFKDSYTDKVQDTITLAEAFDNLQEHFDSKTTGDISILEKSSLKGIICPNYDWDKFKDYHAKKIIGWYNIIIYAINKTEE